MTSFGAPGLSPILPYCLALLAAGLLPIKRRRGYLGVSLSLALLWAYVAWEAWAAHSTPWAVAAALESLVLVVMALWGKLEFGARSGSWATTGSAILIYALAASPLLRHFLPEAFPHPASAMPLPVVLLTCGFLLFAVEPGAVVALIIPLSWALLGGPCDLAGSSDLIEQTELRSALLAGAAYLLQPPKLRRADNHLAPGARYDFAAHWRAVFSRSLWAVSLSTALLVFCYLVRGIDPPRFAVNLTLLVALAIVLWLTFTAWMSLWFRAVAWWAARTVGQAWVWLGQSWRWAILLLAAVALWAVLPFPKDGTGPPAPNRQRTAIASVAGVGVQSSFWRSVQPRRRTLQVFAAVALLWLAYLAYRGRKRLVIGRFVGCTGDRDLDEEVVAGVGPRLQNELARIAEIFTVIDEAIPSQKSQLVQVIPGVQDIGAILKDASAITVGPVKISANLLAGLIGQLVSGPQLIGALHKVDDVYLLTAELSGGGLSFNWQADSKSLGDRRLPPQAIVQELVVQLAFRVATDLVATGSPSWRAVRAFTDGLRAYRETQRRERDKVSVLRQAECCFIKALDEDQQFAQCHFNLGVVYRQLGEIRSAQSAFRRALKEDPDNFEACYALAEALAADEQYARARWFCGAAIAISPHDARTWDLKAYAARYSEQERRRRELALVLPSVDQKVRDLKLTLPLGDPYWSKVQTPGEIAVALAWRSLCRRALSGSVTACERDQLSALTCTRNLAVTFARSSRLPHSRQLLHSLHLFRQAAWLSPHDSALQLYEGRTFFWSGAESALSSLRGIFADGLSTADQAMLWSVLAQADARFAEPTERRTLVRLAHTRFLDVVAGASPDDLADIADLSLEEPPPATTARAARTRRFLAFLRTPEQPTHTRWLEVRNIEEALHGAWGLGGDEEGNGYRKRLRRLCTFLRQLEPDPAGDIDPFTGLAALERGLAQPPMSTGARHERICWLKDLATALEARGADGLPPCEPHTVLCTLQTEPSLPDQTVQSQLERMAHLLNELEPAAADDRATKRGKEARKRWQDCLNDVADDWEWARVQVLVRLARECLRDQPFQPNCLEHAQTAKDALEQAIKWLESKGFNQHRAQDLHGLLAVTYLPVAKDPNTGPEQQREALKRALVYARRAVSLAPESSPARLVLLDVLSALGDPEDIRAQAAIALDLDSGTETLRTIGKSYWDRAATLRGRRLRRKLLHEAQSFFAQALRNIESAPLDERHPLDQVEAHGWAHFWLGRFQSELGSFTSASAHLETACTLGFKPLEARVELAWTCLLAGDRRHGDRAFREAVKEAERCQRTDGVAASPGESRLIEQLLFEARLGWAFLCADWDPDRAQQNVDQAEGLLRSSIRAHHPELKAALLEVRGRVALHRRKLSQSLEHLQESLRQSPGSGAYCALGLANLARAQVAGKGKSPALQRALEAYRLGRESDIRRRHRRELRQLRRELTKQGLLGPRQEARKQPVQTAVPAIPPSPPPAMTPAATTPPDQLVP